MEISLKSLYTAAVGGIGSSLVVLLPAEYHWAAWSTLLLSVIMLIWTTFEFIFNRLKWRFYSNWSFNFSGLLPFKILISLNTAATHAYEVLDHTPIAIAAKRMSQSKPINYMATLIAHAIDLYGTKPYQNKIRLIAKEEIGQIRKDGEIVTPIGNETPTFDNLKVGRRDYYKYLREKLRE